MLSTARVALPANVESRLKTSSAFVDNVMEFAREDLIGFRRPLAATFALSAPPVLALVFHALGWLAMAKVAGAYLIVASLGLVLVGRQLWPGLVEEFQSRAAAKRKAVADLKCGFGEAAFLNLDRSPRFIEHEHGVLAFADAGDFRTLFFSIVNEESDPRWQLYRDGEMDRRVWRWLRLPISREVVKFSTEGSKLPKIGDSRTIDSIDAWEAINTALGEPADGAIIHRPFAEVVDMVERML
ncbi:MAG: hypothetical protein GC153_02485 [Alphaproteobacteria bacterium]|nr:hypothetical protein [Alphaproteobacteria bacterium]